MMRYTLADGTVLDDPQDVTALDDQIAFEDTFGVSFAVCSLREFKHQQWATEVEELTEDWQRQAKEAADAGEHAPPLPTIPDRPEDSYLPTKWAVFFGWRRLRKLHPEQVPASFDDFVVGAQWEYFEDAEPTATAGTGADEALNAEALEGGLGSGLDPTDPAARPTSSPSSSSLPASPTTHS